MPPGPNVLQQAGAKPSRETQGAALFNDRFFSGLWTQRNILRDPSGVVQERWYGGRPDAMLDGLNIELTNRLTLTRAPGSTLFSSTTLPQSANSFYSFKQFTGSSETITVMADTPAILYSINPTSKTTILTKASGAGPAFMIGASNVLYIGDGIEQKAWTPLGGIRNWGIARASQASSVAEYAGAAADSGASWSNPTNIEGAPDMAYATATVTGSAGFATSFLSATTYGFSLSGTTIQTIDVDVTGHIATLVGPWVYLRAQLLVNGNPTGTVLQIPLNSSVDQDYTFTWSGTGWSDGLINASTFGVQIWAISYQYGGGLLNSSGIVNLDSAQITVYQNGSTSGSPTGSGSLATTNGGWSYVYEYANSLSGAFSQATAIGPSTGNFSSKSYVGVPVTASADAQVDQIWVFRTKDGGGTYYSLPTNPYANTTATIHDSNADSSLNILQLPDLNGLNTPPPSGFTAFEFHLSRIWGAVGNRVYSSSGPDLGLILGNGNEGFLPSNFFEFPSAVVKLRSISTVQGAALIVYTTSDIYVILGNGSAIAAQAGVGITVFYAAPLLRHVGLANYWAEDARGAIVYMVTNDGRVISFNPNSQIIYTDPEKSINEIGFPIGAAPPSTSIALVGGTLASFNTATAYLTWHGSGSTDQALYVSDGATGWFRCNPNQQPDGGTVWSTKRNIVGGCSAVQSIETSPGMYQLLIGPTSSSQLLAPRNLAGATEFGSLTPGTYYIAVVGVDGSGNTTTASNEIEVVVGSSQAIAMTCVQDYRASNIRIYYGSTPGGEAHYVTVSSGNSFVFATTSGATSGTPPVSNTTAITGGYVLYRDPTVWSDSGTAYANCKARIGANILAHPGQIANPTFVTCDFAALGSQPSLSVLFDELDATFTALAVTCQDPPHLSAPASLFSNRYYLRQATSGTQPPAACRFMQLWVDFGATDTVQNELLTLTPFGMYEQES